MKKDRKIESHTKQASTTNEKRQTQKDRQKVTQGKRQQRMNKDRQTDRQKATQRKRQQRIKKDRHTEIKRDRKSHKESLNNE